MIQHRVALLDAKALLTNQLVIKSQITDVQFNVWVIIIILSGFWAAVSPIAWFYKVIHSGVLVPQLLPRQDNTMISILIALY